MALIISEDDSVIFCTVQLHHMSDQTSIYKKAMALIKDNQWSKAHDLIESMDTQMASHIHAYLHRIEGDKWNADYWYKRAGTLRPDCSLSEEWSQISSLIADTR